MPHLESFFGKQETRKAQEEGEAEEAEQETSEQRRENKMQREETRKREKEKDTWTRNRGRSKGKTNTERKRQRKSPREECATIWNNFTRRDFQDIGKQITNAFNSGANLPERLKTQSGKFAQLINNINGHTNNQAEADNT